MKNLTTGEEIQLEIGDIVKKDLTSRQSWTVIEINGKLMLHPNTNSYFPDTEPIEITGDYYKIAHTNGLKIEDK